MIVKKEDILKMLDYENNETKINEYYQKAINGDYEFKSYEQIFFFLILLHKCQKKFIYKNVDNLTFFLNRKVMFIDKKFYCHAELLYIAYDYYRKFYNKIKKIDIDNALSLYMFIELMTYNFLCFRYFEAICLANEILEIDPNNDTALYIKAILLETLPINHDDKLRNELIKIYSKIDYTKIEFCKDIARNKINYYNKLKRNSEETYSILTKKYIQEQKIDDYKVFYFENKLQFNYLIEFGPYLETLEDRPIFIENIELNELLKSIYKDFDYSRRKYYCLYESNLEETREWINLFLFTYSIFDRIAYFIYKYFDLDIEEKNVYANQNLFESKIKNTDIQLMDINNQFIYPIYYFCMEISTKPRISAKYRIPDSMFDLRNNLIHRTSMCDINELKKEFNLLIKQSKRLIQYLELTIFIEENRKKQHLDYNNTLFLCSLFSNIFDDIKNEY